MNTDKIIKEAKTIMIANFIVGGILLGIGIAFSIFDVNLIANKKAIIGLSFIPFSVGLIYYYKFSRIKKAPEEMKNIIITENDERLVALKNEAESRAFKIVQAAIFLSYMGYTLLVPEDVFESIGWWILMVLLFIAFMSQGILVSRTLKNQESEEE